MPTKERLPITGCLFIDVVLSVLAGDCSRKHDHVGRAVSQRTSGSARRCDKCSAHSTLTARSNRPGGGSSLSKSTGRRHSLGINKWGSTVGESNSSSFVRPAALLECLQPGARTAPEIDDRSDRPNQLQNHRNDLLGRSQSPVNFVEVPILLSIVVVQQSTFLTRQTRQTRRTTYRRSRRCGNSNANFAGNRPAILPKIGTSCARKSLRSAAATYRSSAT